jgi:hypothetical protein
MKSWLCWLNLFADRLRFLLLGLPVDLIAQETTPGRRRRTHSLNHVLGDGCASRKPYPG